MTFALAVDLLAQNPPRDTGPDFGKASPFGLLIVVLLMVGVFFLIRSMNRHLRKLPKSFEDKESEAAPQTDAEPDADTATGTDDTKPEPGG